MGISKAYLDSSYLLGLIKEEDEADEVRRMLYRLQSNSFEVFIPHIVLGEICGIIFRDFKSDHDQRDKMGKLVDVMISNKIPSENVKPASKDAFGVMAILGRDEWLDPTDTMIVSQVLSDPDSKFFFTTDQNLLGNTAIEDLEKTLRNEGKRHMTLKITDSF